MKTYPVVEITFSPTGGTKKVADLISCYLGNITNTVNLIRHDVSFSDVTVPSDSLAVIAAPVFEGVIPDIVIERMKEIQGNHANCVVIAVYGNRAYDDGLIQLKDTAELCGFNVIASVAAVAEHSIMRQFGSGRPDEAEEMDRLISALKKFTPTRKEHILRTCLITIVLAYSTFFYGAWYGINKSAGYAIRYYFAEISVICVSVTLSCLLIWAMICLYKKQKSLLNRKAARRIIAVSYAALTLFLLSLIGYSFLIVSFGVEGTETVTGQNQHYIYLSVQPDYGIATQYRTDNLIYMQKTGLFLPNTDTLTESSVPDSDPNDSETQDSSTTDSTENSPAQESQKASPLQDEMRAVYQYIQQQNPLPDMNFTYTANAKGENYAILSETTEEKDGTTVNVNYCLYDNGSKTDENNNTFEELVLEKVYPDGGYETELVDFYLVNPETLEVIDEQKSSW